MCTCVDLRPVSWALFCKVGPDFRLVAMAPEQQQQQEVGHKRIRAAVRDIVLVDGHAHNLVELESSFSFVHAFAETGDDVLGDVPHTIPFKVLVLLCLLSRSGQLLRSLAVCHRWMGWCV